jgi:hypothetical protein
MAAMAGHVVAGVALAVALAASGHAPDAVGAAHHRPAPTVSRAGHKPAPTVTPIEKSLVPFAANRGQVDESVRYRAQGSGYHLYLTDAEAVLALRGSGPAEIGVLRLRPVGAAPARAVSGSDRRHVVTRQVWPGIDWAWHGSSKAPTYDLDLAPGVDADAARFEAVGARSLRMDRHGNLLITNAVGVMTGHAPTAWQTARDGSRQPVLVRYVLLDGNMFGFRIGAHDPTRPVTIDVSM